MNPTLQCCYSPVIVAAATALEKLQPSFTAAVTKAYAAAATGVDLSIRHADAVTSDRPTADAACIRCVQGDVGGGRLNTGESLSLVSLLTQQVSPFFKADVRK